MVSVSVLPLVILFFLLLFCKGVDTMNYLVSRSHARKYVIIEIIYARERGRLQKKLLESE